MSKFFAPAARFVSAIRKNEKGTQLVETAVWIGIISAAVVGTIGFIGTEVSTSFNDLLTALRFTP